MPKSPEDAVEEAALVAEQKEAIAAALQEENGDLKIENARMRPLQEENAELHRLNTEIKAENKRLQKEANARAVASLPKVKVSALEEENIQLKAENARLRKEARFGEDIPDEIAELVQEKILAGLPRTQAIQVARDQFKHDLALKTKK